jgi:hypothetical protein
VALIHEGLPALEEGLGRDGIPARRLLLRKRGSAAEAEENDGEREAPRWPSAMVDHAAPDAAPAAISAASVGER